MIAETDIERVFNADVIAELAKVIETPPEAVTPFRDNVRSAVRAYLAERARTNWKAIEEQIRGLYRLADRTAKPRLHVWQTALVQSTKLRVIGSNGVRLARSHFRRKTR